MNKYQVELRMIQDNIRNSPAYKVITALNNERKEKNELEMQRVLAEIKKQKNEVESRAKENGYVKTNTSCFIGDPDALIKSFNDCLYNKEMD